MSIDLSKVLAKRLWLLFRITPEEQAAIEDFQVSHPIYKLVMGSTLGTDHDHTSGLVRGRIDFRVNRALGIIEGMDKENAPAILRAMAFYLEYPPAIGAIGPKYGLIGKAKKKKKMVYGSVNGPLKPERKRGRKET